MAAYLAKGTLKLRNFSTSCLKFDWSKVKPSTFPAVYSSHNVEKEWYKYWESNELFKPSTNGSKGDKFFIVLPPPNITGTLHLGHALTVVTQDVLSRWHRMKKSNVLWVPGIDHAGIATQVVVENNLWKETNQRRLDIGREDFLKEVWKWKEEKGGTINKQLRTLGASLDWSRAAFTMSKSHSEAVNEAVIRLWDAGLFYRKQALVNWSCFLESAISDMEVEYRTISEPTDITIPGYINPVRFGMLDDFAYKIVNSDEEVVVSTTRIETLLGDVAVAVNPADPRYQRFHGAKLWHPFRQTEIPLVVDDVVDIKLGTGAVKITPSHDHTDFDVAERHNLPLIPVINGQGMLHDFPNCSFSGLKRYEARDAIREELKQQGLFRGQRAHEHQLPFCSRSGDVIEYLLKPQWFINCKQMAEKAAEAAKCGQLEIQPDSFNKVWLHWLENIKDWCVSRQLWWGHQLPLYEVTNRNDSSKTSTWIAAHSLTEAESKAVSMLNVPISDLSIERDPDVLDTWFSSGILPFAVFGWPNKTEDYTKFYPLTTMITGHDILFFWVARMVMLGLQLTGQLPFKKVLLHGVICDNQGRKMSKSLGNVINPEDVIRGISRIDLKSQINASFEAGQITATERDRATDGQKELFPTDIPDCGTDALRFTLISQNIYSHFIQFDTKECISNRSFCNKIWQAFRYTISRVSELKIDVKDASVLDVDLKSLSLADRWILSKLSEAVVKINDGLEKSEFDKAADAFKQFFYGEFCDIYVESTKSILNKGTSKEANATCATLLHCLDVSLRLLAPFMPYISEELNSWLPGKRCKTLMLADFPSKLQYKDSELEEEVDVVLGVTSTIRSIKTLHKLQNTPVHVEIESKKADLLTRHYRLLNSLLKDDYVITENCSTDRNEEEFACAPFSYHTHIYIQLPNANNQLSEEQIQVLMRKEMKITKVLDKLLQTIENEGFKEKAPPAVQQRHKEKILSLQEELVHLRRKLDSSMIASKSRGSG